MNQLINKANAEMRKLQGSLSCILKGSIPILWFGDRGSYEQSELKVITVALNPSDNEFHDKNQNNVNVSLRFEDYDGSISSLEKSYNNYFQKNPYKQWFDAGFEPILNGMEASYYSDKGYAHRALHTDLCCPFATCPTWSKLSENERKQLLNSGFQLWKDLVNKLKPDVIIFSVANDYINMLGITQFKRLCEFKCDKNGNPRKLPVEIKQSRYNNARAVFGKTWRLPFGALGKNQKEELGKKI